MIRLAEGLLFVALIAFVAILARDIENVRHEVQALQVLVHNMARAQAVQRKATSVRPPPAEARVQVTVSGLSYIFRPKYLRIKVGTRVTWVNMTASPHSVASRRRGLFDEIIAPHGHIALTFNRRGRFLYYCQFHPDQLGTIVVTG